MLIHPSLRSDTTILASEYVDGIAIDIRVTRMACIYLPPSLSQDARLDVLWQFSEYDVIVGDLNIRMSGSNRPNVTVREALLHFAENQIWNYMKLEVSWIIFWLVLAPTG